MNALQQQDTPRPDAAIANRNVMLIREALGDLELTDAEVSSLAWLAGWETSTVQNIISAFERAGAAR